MTTIHTVIERLFEAHLERTSIILRDEEVELLVDHWTNMLNYVDHLREEIHPDGIIH